MISKASKYAINAAIYLALDTHEGKKLSAKEIAEAIDVPVAFLAKLLQDLARKNVISSTKGPKGGFYLTKENRAQKLLIVLKEIEGLSKLKECMLGLKHCSNEKPCPIHFLAQPLKQALVDELGKHSIAEFAEKVQKGNTFLSI